MLLFIIGCTNTAPKPIDTVAAPSAQSVEFQAQYIRTDWQAEGIYPNIVKVLSLADYSSFIDASFTNKKRFEAQLTPTNGFTDDFFANNMLLLITLQEGSGSTRHAVKSIDNDGNIAITRELPEIGTADMAQWVIVIELPKTFANKDFKLIITNGI